MEDFFSSEMVKVSTDYPERTSLNDFNRRCTSTISARMSSLVTADKRALAALTIAPRFIELQGSVANSSDASLIVSPGITVIAVDTYKIIYDNILTFFFTFLSTFKNSFISLDKVVPTTCFPGEIRKLFTILSRALF